MQGGLIAVRPVLFSQGINEQQTYANAIGESSVQDWINWESLLLLRAYCQDFKAFLSAAAPGKTSAAKADLADGAVNSLAASIVSARRNKNTDVLTLGEKAARLYGCARGARHALIWILILGAGPVLAYAIRQPQRRPDHVVQERQGPDVHGRHCRGRQHASGAPHGRLFRGCQLLW